MRVDDAVQRGVELGVGRAAGLVACHGELKLVDDEVGWEVHVLAEAIRPDVDHHAVDLDGVGAATHGRTRLKEAHIDWLDGRSVHSQPPRCIDAGPAATDDRCLAVDGGGGSGGGSGGSEEERGERWHI